MADNLTIARPYAKAAFNFAYEHKSIQKWKTFLENLAYLVDNSNIVSSSEVQSKQDTTNFIAFVLESFTDEYCLNFVRILVDNKRLAFCSDILQEFNNFYELSKTTLKAIVISAAELSQKQLLVIKEKLENKYKSLVIIENQLDESLIAGFKIMIADEVIDASVKNQLEKLSTLLA